MFDHIYDWQPFKAFAFCSCYTIVFVVSVQGRPFSCDLQEKIDAEDLSRCMQASHVMHQTNIGT